MFSATERANSDSEVCLKRLRAARRSDNAVSWIRAFRRPGALYETAEGLRGFRFCSRAAYG